MLNLGKLRAMDLTSEGWVQATVELPVPEGGTQVTYYPVIAWLIVEDHEDITFATHAGFMATKLVGVALVEGELMLAERIVGFKGYRTGFGRIPEDSANLHNHIPDYDLNDEEAAATLENAEPAVTAAVKRPRGRPRKDSK